MTSKAVVTDASSVTSRRTNRAPSSVAADWPRSTLRAPMYTVCPRSISWRAVS